jgi:flagellar biosynthetic protein FliR
MFSLYKLPEAEIILFALVLFRLTAFIISCAVIGSPQVPTNMKVLLSIVLAVMLYPLVQKSSFEPQFVIDNFISLTAREILVGLSLGFLTRLFFFAVSMTGDLIAVSIGLSSSQLYNPMTGSTGTSLEQFFTLLATLVFLTINGHHLLISAIAESFQMIPLSNMGFNVGALGEAVQYGQDLMVITLKMVAPIMISILAVNLAMGILGRAVPQMNILVTSMPITIGVGLIVLFICLPLLVMEMNFVIDITATKMMAVMKAL